MNTVNETTKIKKALVAIVRDLQGLEERLSRVECCLGNEDTLDMMPPEEVWPDKFVEADSE